MLHSADYPPWSMHSRIVGGRMSSNNKSTLNLQVRECTCLREIKPRTETRLLIASERSPVVVSICICCWLEPDQLQSRHTYTAPVACGRRRSPARSCRSPVLHSGPQLSVRLCAAAMSRSRRPAPAPEKCQNMLARGVERRAFRVRAGSGNCECFLVRFDVQPTVAAQRSAGANRAPCPSTGCHIIVVCLAEPSQVSR